MGSLQDKRIVSYVFFCGNLPPKHYTLGKYHQKTENGQSRNPGFVSVQNFGMDMVVSYSLDKWTRTLVFPVRSTEFSNFQGPGGFLWPNLSRKKKSSSTSLLIFHDFSMFAVNLLDSRKRNTFLVLVVRRKNRLFHAVPSTVNPSG